MSRCECGGQEYWTTTTISFDGKKAKARVLKCRKCGSRVMKLNEAERIRKQIHINKISAWVQKYKKDRWNKALKKHKGNRVKAYMDDEIY